MNDLKNSGLNLRTINVVDYAQLVEDLQYNFSQILNLPGFKGMPGQSIVGETGIGVRGSKWIFVTLDDIRSSYPTVTSVEHITLSWVNSTFNADPTKLFESLYIPGDDSLLIGDILVLPSGQLIELAEITVDDITDIMFIDTGITFAQVSSLTETRVIELFNQMYGDTNTSTSALRHFNAVAKNGADTSPALNNDLNQDSVIDIVTAGTGPGVALPLHTFVAATEQAVGVTTKMCFIAGSPKRYHELIQSTQNVHTNNYAPGIDDFASGVFLQNSYNNGIIFGHAEAESIRQFGRLFRTVDSTVLTSSYSPFENEFSELRLSDSTALLRAISATINVTTMDVMAQNYNSKFFSYAGTVAKLANVSGASVEIYAPAGTYLKNVTSASFLSTEASGKIIKTYSLINTLTGTLNSNQIVDALTIQTALATINGALGSLNSRVTTLETADSTKYFQKLPWQIASTNFNTLTDNGNYVIASGQPISNFIPTMSVAPTDMIVNSFVSSIDATNMRVLQEVTMTGTTEFSLYMNGIKWFRIGSKTGAGAWSFSLWSKTVTGNDKVNAEGALIASGSFNTGNMKIVHKPKSPGLISSTNSGQSVIRNIVFDEYGHVMGYENTTIASESISTAVAYLYSWSTDRKYTVAHNVPPGGTIIASYPFLECRTATGGYAVGDVATVQYPGQDQDGSNDYDYGIGLQFKQTGSATLTVACGDRVFLRYGSADTSTHNNSFGVNPAQWYVRVVTFYMAAPPAPTADTAPPTEPYGLSGSTSPGQNRFSWSASVDIGTAGLAGYEVLRSSSEFGIYSYLVNTSQTFIDDASVEPNTDYWYKVRAFDNSSNYSTITNSLLIHSEEY